MNLGILSDTHDRLDAMKAGMKLLKEHGAEFFIHCGDIGSEQIIDCLAGEKSIFVLGNTDFDRADLARYAAEIGVDCRNDWGEIKLSGKKIVVTHGDDSKLLRNALALQDLDYLLHGHTHIATDERHGKLRIINPGALHRASVKSVAILNLETDSLEFFPLNI
jgi:putative phosphoesterase